MNFLTPTLIALMSISFTALGVLISRVWFLATQFASIKTALDKTRVDINTVGKLVKDHDRKGNRRYQQQVAALLAVHADDPKCPCIAAPGSSGFDQCRIEAQGSLQEENLDGGSVTETQFIDIGAKVVVIASVCHSCLPPWDFLNDFPRTQKFYKAFIYLVGFIAINGRSTVYTSISTSKTGGVNETVKHMETGGS